MARLGWMAVALGGGIAGAAIGVRTIPAAPSLVASGFEGGVALAAPAGGWQDIVGRDGVTGAAWPLRLWGGRMRLQLLDGAGGAPGVVEARIEAVTGHDGTPTRALRLAVLRRAVAVTQVALLLRPQRAPEEFHIALRMRLPDDLGARLGPGGWAVVGPEWKSAGDFRVVTTVEVDQAGRPYWRMRWDSDANGPVPLRTFWNAVNREVAVPEGRWFRLDFYTRRAVPDGRTWLKLDGRTLFDHQGDTIGTIGAPINRIFIALAYASRPIEVLVDDIEIGEGPPRTAGAALTPPRPPSGLPSGR